MMKLITLLTFVAIITPAFSTVELTAENFKEKTNGKKVMIKFYAPWCGHCKKLAPVWDEFAEQTNVLVAKVDCTVHKELCQKQGVQGYPTLKYSNGYGLNKYENGRDLESLLEFVENNLQNGCLDDPNLCSEEEAKELEEYKALSMEDIHKRLDNNEAEKESAEILFKGHVQKLQDKYNTLQKEKNDKLKELSKEEALLRYVLNLPDEEEEEKKEEL